jgi:hypothetical protein
LTVSPVKNPKGKIVGASKIARDITERRRAELASKQCSVHAGWFCIAQSPFAALLLETLGKLTFRDRLVAIAEQWEKPCPKSARRASRRGRLLAEFHSVKCTNWRIFATKVT